MAQVCQHKFACFVRCWPCWQALACRIPGIRNEKIGGTQISRQFVFLAPAMDWWTAGEGSWRKSQPFIEKKEKTLSQFRSWAEIFVSVVTTWQNMQFASANQRIFHTTYTPHPLHPPTLPYWQRIQRQIPPFFSLFLSPSSTSFWLWIKTRWGASK